ncbi:MAG: hypothetical protein SGPRY_000922 [Prymnesium sp.]
MGLGSVGITHILEIDMVHEFRTSQYGDSKDNFVRLASRSLTVVPPAAGAAVASISEPRVLSRYRNPEARDRDRSSRLPFEQTCQAVASAQAGMRVEELCYSSVIMLFAAAWAAAYLPVPGEFLNRDALPAASVDRAHQQVRGVGDGRSVAAAAASFISSISIVSWRSGEESSTHYQAEDKNPEPGP